MTDQLKGRSRRDDSLVPLLTGLVVLAVAGPALFTALTQWVVPRLTAGRDAVSLSLGEWLEANWWLLAFWMLELAVLLVVLAWSRRRRTRRTRQLNSLVTGLLESSRPTGSRTVIFGWCGGTGIVRSGCGFS